MLQILMVANSLDVADIASTVDIANTVDVATADVADIIVIQISESTGKVSIMLMNIEVSIDADSSSG